MVVLIKNFSRKITTLFYTLLSILILVFFLLFFVYEINPTRVEVQECTVVKIVPYLTTNAYSNKMLWVTLQTSGGALLYREYGYSDIKVGDTVAVDIKYSSIDELLDKYNIFKENTNEG